MECSGIQDIYDRLTRGVHLPTIYTYAVIRGVHFLPLSIYICSVAVYKASMIN